MDEPITKERLKKYPELKMEIENHLERLARMKSNEIMPAMKEGDGSQHTPSASDRMANAIIKCMDYTERSAERINGILREMEIIETAIESLPDPMEREVLRLRYIDGRFSRPRPWQEVSLRLYGDNDEKSMTATFRAHGRALQSIEKVTSHDAETVCKTHDG